MSGNQWFGNGPTLTQFSPYGVFSGGNGPNTAYDLSPKVGLAGTFPVVKGDTPMYAYGHVGYLMAGIAGQANGTPGCEVLRRLGRGLRRASWAAAATAAGTSWQYNLSYGLQSYCVGGGCCCARSPAVPANARATSPGRAGRAATS